jgi:hypothetical protein
MTDKEIEDMKKELHLVKYINDNRNKLTPDNLKTFEKLAREAIKAARKIINKTLIEGN